MLILKALCHGRMHGYRIAKLKSESEMSDNNQRGRYYSLTRADQKQLNQDEANWERLSTTVTRILRSA